MSCIFCCSVFFLETADSSSAKVSSVKEHRKLYSTTWIEFLKFKVGHYDVNLLKYGMEINSACGENDSFTEF